MLTTDDDLLPIPRHVLDQVLTVLRRESQHHRDAAAALEAAIRDAKAVESRAAADWREIRRRWPRVHEGAVSVDRSIVIYRPPHEHQ